LKKLKKVEKVEPTSPVQETTFRVKVLQQAKNPQWIYCQALHQDMGKLPVVIPRRLTNKLVGKQVLVEAITDNVGTTYRYVQDQPH